MILADLLGAMIKIGSATRNRTKIAGSRRADCARLGPNAKPLTAARTIRGTHVIATATAATCGELKLRIEPSSNSSKSGESDSLPGSGLLSIAISAI